MKCFTRKWPLKVQRQRRHWRVVCTGLFLITSNPPQLLMEPYKKKYINKFQKNPRIQAPKLTLPCWSLAIETQESNFLSCPPTNTQSMNHNLNIPGFMRRALFLQVVQKVRSTEFGNSLEPLPSWQHIFSRRCVSQQRKLPPPKFCWRGKGRPRPPWG